MFVVGNVLAQLSLLPLSPYSHFVHRYIWIQQNGFFSGIEMLLWPPAGFALFLIWSFWTGFAWFEGRWWRDVIPAVATFVLMMVVFDTPDTLIDAYCFTAGTIASLLAYWIVRMLAKSSPIEAD